MKTSVLFILLFAFFTNANAQMIFPQQKIPAINTESIMSYLTQENKELQQPDISLQLVFYKKSYASHHYTFDILYKNIPLLYAGIKINIDFKGNILSVKKENVQTNNLAPADIENEVKEWKKTDIAKIFAMPDPIREFKLKIDARSDIPQVVAVINTYDKTYDKTYIINQQGEITDEWNNGRYLKTDTVIHAKVFKPDPLTSTGVSYGAPYIDDNDNNLGWFSPAYIQVDIPATFETGNNTFYLENKWVVIEDFQNPVAAPAISITPDFYFNRSESGFEDVNIMYHISNFHDYISSIGYDTLMDDIITVDAHGMLGADNSMFNRNGGSPTLNFGTGGVDDGEDADVIIHEYSHALSWSANNNDNFSTSRSGLDEGLSDYFATSYSRSINPFGWEKMFSWDGHNEYWGGRVANTPNNYPGAMNIYAIGEIWNAAMSAIWTDLGQIVTDKLMLESMHFFTNSTTLPEAAVYLLQSDTILFNGIHANTICTHFQNKNILDGNCKPTAVSETESTQNSVKVNNTYGFTYRNESIEILFPKISSGELTLFDLQGNKILQEKFVQKERVYFSADHISRGIYFLHINAEKNLKVVKISK